MHALSAAAALLGASGGCHAAVLTSLQVMRPLTPKTQPGPALQRGIAQNSYGLCRRSRCGALVAPM